MKEILVLVASSGKNLELAKLIDEEAHKVGLDSSILNLCDFDFPLYDSKKNIDLKNQGLIMLSQKISEVSGLVFVAPEYNGGVPPVLSNALCLLSQLDPKNWRSLFEKKMAVVASQVRERSKFCVND